MGTEVLVQSVIENVLLHSELLLVNNNKEIDTNRSGLVAATNQTLMLNVMVNS